MRCQDALDVYNYRAKGVSRYEASLGVDENTLKQKLNDSENRAMADPLNVSAWKDVSSAASDLAVYHKYDSSSDYFTIKDEAEGAVTAISKIQEEGIDYYERDVGGDMNPFLKPVIAAASEEKTKADTDAALQQVRDVYETAAKKVANETDLELLAMDYIGLGNAISAWNEFNDSQNIHYVPTKLDGRLEAVKCLDKAIASDPKARYWIEEGQIYNAMRDKKNAVRCFDSGIAAAKDNGTLIEGLYLKAKDETDLDQAAKCYEKILTMDSYDSRIWKLVSAVYKKEGRFNDATTADAKATLFKGVSRSTLPILPSETL